MYIYKESLNSNYWSSCDLEFNYFSENYTGSGKNSISNQLAPLDPSDI